MNFFIVHVPSATETVLELKGTDGNCESVESVKWIKCHVVYKTKTEKVHVAPHELNSYLTILYRRYDRFNYFKIS